MFTNGFVIHLIMLPEGLLVFSFQGKACQSKSEFFMFDFIQSIVNIFYIFILNAVTANSTRNMTKSEFYYSNLNVSILRQNYCNQP